MSSRPPLIAANWKMNPAPTALSAYKSLENVDCIVFPTFLDIGPCIKADLAVGGQFGHPKESGAHTGDVSMKQLKEIGCQYVLCGHSERRQYHKETNEFVAEQVASALENGLHPILCVGETDEERKAGKEKEVVRQQIDVVFERVNELTSHELTIAYEPVWAIGTGNTATPEDAQEMHSFIRSLLPETQDMRHETRILYGGSMKPDNAEDLLSQPDIDGGLVGGASLDPEKFKKIVDIASDHE
jgi:triosephosphate isomerase (TIM)